MPICTSIKSSLYLRSSIHKEKRRKLTVIIASNKRQATIHFRLVVWLLIMKMDLLAVTITNKTLNILVNHVQLLMVTQVVTLTISIRLNLIYKKVVNLAKIQMIYHLFINKTKVLCIPKKWNVKKEMIRMWYFFNWM